MMSRQWIDKEEALRLLDVKAQTLYAYVSRQKVAAKPDPENPKKSLYAKDDLEILAKRHPGRQSPLKPQPIAPRVLGGGVLVRGEGSFSTELSVLVDGQFFIRDREIKDLAKTETLETLCAYMWYTDHNNPFGSLKPRPDVNFPGGPRTRALHMLSRRIEEDTLNERSSPQNLIPEAAGLLNELVDAITNGGPRLYFHQRLARSWKVLTPKDVDLLRLAMVLCADFELDDATLSVRISASGGGPLALALMNGFATAMGPKIGGRITKAEAFVTKALRMGNPALVLKAHLAQNEIVPGFEPYICLSEKTRAASLLQAFEAALSKQLRDIVTLCQEAMESQMGLSMALAILGRHLDLPRDAPLTLYGVGRSVGWLAHAIEQIKSKQEPRYRLRYIGVDPHLKAVG
jgi:citrate synthase